MPEPQVQTILGGRPGGDFQAVESVRMYACMLPSCDGVECADGDSLNAWKVGGCHS